MVTGRIVGPNGRNILRKKWEELTTLLNSLGYGSKTSEKWQKTWSDYKYHLKRKASDIKRNQVQPGGGAFHKDFKEHELLVLNLMGPTFYEGLGNDEVGINIQEKQLQSSFSAMVSLPPPAESIPPIPPTPAPKSFLVQPPTSTVVQSPAVPSTTVDISQPSCSTTASNCREHNYYKIKRRSQSTVEDAYIETIAVLKDIHNTITSD
ncbi:myb/sant-like dna-binding domain [Holotrichia oblita]|uniref:Myb/sant-like dna-binding domain n=1 Tax=Holotrichia oblita TaxID=644536 RepID=A0ACB9TV23_HOLOL|nr:myb/sant-like dna-binding domain [Holotrichia oblita]